MTYKQILTESIINIIDESIVNVISSEFYKFIYPNPDIANINIKLVSDSKTNFRSLVIEDEKEEKDQQSSLAKKDAKDAIDLEMFIMLYDYANTILFYLNTKLGIPLMYKNIKCTLPPITRKSKYRIELPFYLSPNISIKSDTLFIEIISNNNCRNVFSNLISIEVIKDIDSPHQFEIHDTNIMYRLMSGAIKKHMMHLLGKSKESKESLENIYEMYIPRFNIIDEF